LERQRPKTFQPAIAEKTAESGEHVPSRAGDVYTERMRSGEHQGLPGWKRDLVGNAYLDLRLVRLVVERTGTTGSLWDWRIEDHGRAALVRSTAPASSVRDAQVSALLRLHEAYTRQLLLVAGLIADAFQRR
jgi:hypothetical protein